MRGVVVRDVDEYISQQPLPLRKTLEKLRFTIKKAAPQADEVISYMMPAYKYQGVIVYFGAYKNHVGFYPTGAGIAAFKKELADFECSKGTVRFPIDKPLPFNLITRIVKFRVNENLNKKIKSSAKK